MGDHANHQYSKIDSTPQTLRQDSAAARFQGTGLAGKRLLVKDGNDPDDVLHRRQQSTDPATTQIQPGPGRSLQEQAQRKATASREVVSVITRTRLITISKFDPVRPLRAERKAPSPPSLAAARVPFTKPNSPGDVIKEDKPSVRGTESQASAAAVRPERRISSMNEAQIMEKLRSVVNSADPAQRYAKIKKVGQGYVP